MHPAPPCLLRTALLSLLVGVSTGPTTAFADEASATPHPIEIESLTPEQARKLVADFPGTSVAFRNDKGKFKVPLGLPLNSLKTLDAATAACLADYRRGGPLSLNRLASLDAETAATLATFQGNALSLNGLTALTTDAARALARFQGHILSVQGLHTLDAATAAALAESPAWDGRLMQLGPAVSLEVAEALAACRGGQGLSLPGLSELPTEIAALLATVKGDGLSFASVVTMSADTAKALAAFKGRWLYLDGLEALDADTARALAEFNGEELSLAGLTTLDAATAEILAASAAWNGRLPSLSRCDAATARVLAQSRAWDGRLQSLQAIDAATAEALAAYAGERLEFSLKAIDAASARALARHENMLFLGGLSTLGTDVAAALAEFKGKLLDLSGVRTIEADVARALAEFRGDQLRLTWLTTSDEDTLAALAGCAGERLTVPQIIDKIGAEIPLTPQTARLVCAAWAKSCVVLTHVTAFESPDSIAIAGALATRRGCLSLPNLRKISPKTVVALIEKEDVIIPPLDTLELIPEPDGSIMRDFVVPEGFLERQRGFGEQPSE